MQLEGQPLFNRREMIEAIREINSRWGQRLCTSASVQQVKAYDPDPTVPKRGFETTTSKTLFCLSPYLSLPAWGMEVQVAYLPEKAYAKEDNPDDPAHLSTEDIDIILEFCYQRIGSLRPDEGFEDLVEKTVQVEKYYKGTSGMKASTVWKQIWDGKTALVNAAQAAYERRQKQEITNALMESKPAADP